jgi:hypothetical protein
MMLWIEKDGLRYCQFEIFQEAPVFHAVFSRQGGVSQPPFDGLNTGGTVGDHPEAVMENHIRIFKTAGVDFSSRFDVWQVHGKKIMAADAPRPTDVPHPKADGILTDRKGVTLFMRFADCVPVLLVDPVRKVIGIVHAGWQGTQKKIAREAVREMTRIYGSEPSDILAGIGPAICQNCYQVGDEVVRLFRDSFGKAAQTLFAQIEGKPHLDLWKANQVTLQEAGVTHIERSELCTSCHTSDWFSHRAENGQTGRFAVLMALTEDH